MKRKRAVSLILSAVMAFTMAAVTLPANLVKAESTGSLPMFRLYNPNSGEHFYTANIIEKNNLDGLGWSVEGVGWGAPETSNTPVYRLYNPNSGDHHYTADDNERQNCINAGWNDEGIGWYSDSAKTIPEFGF